MWCLTPFYRLKSPFITPLVFVCVCVSGCICTQCVVCSPFAKQRLQTNLDSGSLDPLLLTLLANTGPLLFHIVKWGVEVNE